MSTATLRPIPPLGRGREPRLGDHLGRRRRRAERRPQRPLPLDPPRERGASITPAYEGWYPNADGRFSLLLGYYNRNAKEALDIPVGPNNQIEPGRPGSGAADAFRDRPPVGRLRRQGAEGFRHQGGHLDDRRQRRDAGDSVHAEQGLSDQPLQGARHGQPAAGAGVFAGWRRRSPGRRSAVAATLHRHGEPAGPDQRLGRGSEGAERGEMPGAAAFRGAVARWRPSRCTSSAGRAR